MSGARVGHEWSQCHAAEVWVCYGREKREEESGDSSVGDHANGVPVPSLGLLRKRAGLSQRELADQAGVGRYTISRLEHGANARYDTIDKLAKALGTVRARLIQPPPQAQKRKHHRGNSGEVASYGLREDH